MDVNSININPDYYFINVEDTSRLIEITKQIDFNYLNGAICLEYLDKTIMDFKLWDLVDQLWSYILNLLEDLINNGEGVTFFPDQPIKLEVRDISKEFILFNLDYGNVVNYTFPKKEFLNAILYGAESFYKNMNKAFGEVCKYEFEMGKIIELRSRFENL